MNLYNVLISSGFFLEARERFRRAEILERRGDAEAALRHYRRFVELRTDADPELQARVREARARIDEIAAERG